jgi:hypothetical protein
MSQNYWLCSRCGYTAKGDQPVMCPICKAAGDTFTLIDKSMFEAAAKTEGTLETELAYDDVPMTWTKDAKEAIRAVPAGFQRRRCKAKIEKTARKMGMTTITLEFAKPYIDEAASEEYTPIFANKGTGAFPPPEKTEAPQPAAPQGSRFTWTPDAVVRLERAPVGYMRDCTRALIEKHAEKIAATTITYEIAEAGIEQAKGYMEEAMKTGNLKDIIESLIGNKQS